MHIVQNCHSGTDGCGEHCHINRKDTVKMQHIDDKGTKSKECRNSCHLLNDLAVGIYLEVLQSLIKTPVTVEDRYQKQRKTQNDEGYPHLTQIDRRCAFPKQRYGKRTGQCDKGKHHDKTACAENQRTQPAYQQNRFVIIAAGKLGNQRRNGIRKSCRTDLKQNVVVIIGSGVEHHVVFCRNGSKRDNIKKSDCLR